MGAPSAGAPGAAYTFILDSDWHQSAQLRPARAGPGDLWGTGVGVHRGRAFVGGAGNNAPGAAAVFAGVDAFRDCDGNGEHDLCDILTGVLDDANANDIPDICEAVGDLDGDGMVGFADLLMLLTAWGLCKRCPPPCSGDLNQDCVVGFMDVVQLLSNWGRFKRQYW